MNQEDFERAQADIDIAEDAKAAAEAIWQENQDSRIAWQIFSACREIANDARRRAENIAEEIARGQEER